jgi:hypothetical protein
MLTGLNQNLMATLVNKMNRDVKVIIPNMREFRVFYSDNEGSTMFFKRDWEEEKTTEQEEQEWSDEDKAIVGCIACCLDGQFVTEVARKQCLEWFNKHRRDFLNAHHTEWSEEDEEISKRIISDLRWGRRNSVSDKDIRQYDEEINWMENKLKSLLLQGSKDSLQTHWKPSEEQMEVLLSTQDMVRSSGYRQNAKVLASIYEQLKKLM